MIQNIYKGVPMYDDILKYLLFKGNMIIFLENEKYRCISRKDANINLERIQIRMTNKFIYIGTIILNNGTIIKDVENRIRKSSNAFTLYDTDQESKKIN